MQSQEGCKIKQGGLKDVSLLDDVAKYFSFVWFNAHCCRQNE